MTETVTREGAYIIWRVRGKILASVRADGIEGVKDCGRCFGAQKSEAVDIILRGGVVSMCCSPDHIHSLMGAKEEA